jgi:hypothetical protein
MQNDRWMDRSMELEEWPSAIRNNPAWAEAWPIAARLRPRSPVRWARPHRKGRPVQPSPSSSCFSLSKGKKRPNQLFLLGSSSSSAVTSDRRTQHPKSLPSFDAGAYQAAGPRTSGPDPPTAVALRGRAPATR